MSDAAIDRTDGWKIRLLEVRVAQVVDSKHHPPPCYAIRERLGMEGQIRYAHTHVMQNAVGEGGGDGQSKQGMHNAQGVDIAIAVKHLTKEQPARQRSQGEDGIG